MAFSGFNQLVNRVSAAANDISTTVSTINQFTGGLGRSSLNRVGNIADSVGAGANVISAAQGFLSGTGNARQLGSALRMFGNATQGVGFNAAPQDRRVQRAVLSRNIANINEGDWRVSISVPPELNIGNVLRPLFTTKRTGGGANAVSSVGRMIFPFNPTILLGHSANYSQIAPTHTNYPCLLYTSDAADE